jgi:Predicted ATPase (AAA+ superfamily)
MSAKIIGRQREIAKLDKMLASKEAEFTAVYGRRRVGKTFLIHNFCKNKGLYFELSGLKNGKLSEQLANFTTVYSELFEESRPLLPPKRWLAAFTMLNKKLNQLPSNQTIILFFDELPWLAGKRSGFMQAMDYVWNKYWSKNPCIKLIVCGSAASWMIDNLINDKGGLYNRVTNILLLKTLSLQETEIYLQYRGVNLTRRQLLEIYMVMGGVPHYLNQVEKNKSSTQNINNICFKEDGVLFGEFTRIFKSLFSKYTQNRAIVMEISKHHNGISRDLLLKKLKITTGGTFKKRIGELEASGFVQTFIPYGNLNKKQCYRIIDEYTLFYMRWIDPIRNQATLNFEKDYWITKVNTPEWFAWSGYAFENICYKHVPNILRALQVENIPCEIGTWRATEKPKSTMVGAQIDLIIDRSDDVIMLGEIKFTKDVFSIDKAYAMTLKNKIEAFTRHFKTKKQLQLVIIASADLKPNIWSEDLIAFWITSDAFLIDPLTIYGDIVNCMNILHDRYYT